MNNLKERFDALPMQMQLDLTEDIHEALENRLVIYEKYVRTLHEESEREGWRLLEVQSYVKDAKKAMEKAFPNVPLPKYMMNRRV